MKIQDMFVKDIDRHINGVIKVDQEAEDAVRQEVGEYVVTTELRQHFSAFFKAYNRAFEYPNDNIGVWISGFFGSGKSHFLKMLSYLLANRPVGETDTVSLFREKLADATDLAAAIDQAAQAETETILFNISAQSAIDKERDVVLDVFAKMFYTHLGFFGANLKVARMEEAIDRMGRTEDFRSAFLARTGQTWESQRSMFHFHDEEIIDSLRECFHMSEESAKRFIYDRQDAAFSIDTFVDDIVNYIGKKPDHFRLLFMIDEVGQFVGTYVDRLLSLQTLVEEIGRRCGGKIWVVCTGQEALDQVIKVRMNEFSRIQARFDTRLSLSSSSVDEVIQRRILEKTPEAKMCLAEVYRKNSVVLANLFTFETSLQSIKGCRDEEDFIVNFPFVSYQFPVMQDVFTEIRRHGNAGTHLSGGERSLLSGFQEAAQQIESRDEMSLAPFYLFYDTVQTFLDSSIRRVIDRCAKAAEKGEGVKADDVNVLKLLYLIRYIDAIPANLENITILMADRIDIDKLALKDAVRKCLDRLETQNYIGHTGELYQFLTDEEQDVQREINSIDVEADAVVRQMGSLLFGDLYPEERITLGKSNFAFDRLVDGRSVSGQTGNELSLQFLTVLTDDTERSPLRLAAYRGAVLVILPEDDERYYENLVKAEKIRKYATQRSMNQLAASVREILRAEQDKAQMLRESAREDLTKAVERAEFYINGKPGTVRGKTAKERIRSAMEQLAAEVYSELGCIDTFEEKDEDIAAILQSGESELEGMTGNERAMKKMEDFLRVKSRTAVSVTMEDVQRHFQKAPYGWREIDIAGIAARLIRTQKVEVKYGGVVMKRTDPQLIARLRRRSETPRTAIAIRVAVAAGKIREARQFLQDYFGVMDVPEKEDDLVAFIQEKFGEQRAHYQQMEESYRSGRKYPGRANVQQAVGLIGDVLAAGRGDHTAFINALLKAKSDLKDSREDLEDVEDFFAHQKPLFDKADAFEKSLQNELSYFDGQEDITDALNGIRRVTYYKGNFPYEDVPKLDGYVAAARAAHDRLLVEKRSTLYEQAQQCRAAVFDAAGDNAVKAKDLLDAADRQFAAMKNEIGQCQSLALLDGMTARLFQYKDDMCRKIERRLAPPRPAPQSRPASGKRDILPLYRQVLFPQQMLDSEAAVDDYVEKLRYILKARLHGHDGIDLR